MKISFSKYHGTGNDFIMIDDRTGLCNELTESQIKTLCDRRFGIGADGLIALKNSDTSDFRMNYYNADGKEGSMCGNGGRCITAFAHRLDLFEKRCVFSGSDGQHLAVRQDDGLIRLRLRDVKSINQLEDGFLLDTGSPHFVRFTQGLETIDMNSEGKKIRSQRRFSPGGVNVNFVERLGNSRIAVRSFERGVEAETLSCGTGVSASVLCAALDNKKSSGLFEVKTPGGQLQVAFKRQGKAAFSDLFLIGPAIHVYDGSIELRHAHRMV